jgi:hypothetical protein
MSLSLAQWCKQSGPMYHSLLHAFDHMEISHSLLKPADNPLYGFGGKGTFHVGKIELPLSFGVAPPRGVRSHSTLSTWSTQTTP